MSNFDIVAVCGLAAPAPSLMTAQFDPYVILRVFVRVPSQSVAGIPVLQFNGDTGTTAYAYNVTNTTLVLGIVTPVGAIDIAGSANGIFLAQGTTTGPVVAEAGVGNGPGQTHGIIFHGMAGIMDASAAPAVVSGAGIWANTARVQSIQLTSSGGGNLGAGTGLLVLGVNP